MGNSPFRVRRTPACYYFKSSQTPLFWGTAMRATVHESRVLLFSLLYLCAARGMWCQQSVREPMLGGQRPIETVTLKEARRVLADPSGNDTLASIPLAEFESFREIDIGSNRRVLAISCSHSGGLIAFANDGKFIASIRTGEITSFQVFDLAEDGNSMIVTDEVEGEGTGLLVKSFSMYRTTRGEIRKIWTGESFLRSAPWTPSGNIQVTEKKCYVRFDPASAAIRGTMTHACAAADGRHLTLRIYEWREDSLKEQNRNP